MDTTPRLRNAALGALAMTLVVAAVPPSGAADANDDVIKSRVERALGEDPELRGGRITVRSVDGGVVQLAGEAITPTQHLRALEDAMGVEGVKRVASDVTSPHHR